MTNTKHVNHFALVTCVSLIDIKSKNHTYFCYVSQKIILMSFVFHHIYRRVKTGYLISSVGHKEEEMVDYGPYGP